MKHTAGQIALSLVALVAASAAYAQNTTVTAQVVVVHAHGKSRGEAGNENVVVWMTPLDRPIPAAADLPRFRMVQRNKQFFPHVLPVPVGAAVEFPNTDPYFHNVFSLYRGERFDLGLYEAGRSRIVHFDRPGVSFVFCNIHPGMSAYVLALSTPYFAVSNSQGQVAIPDVPPGRYRLQAWYERSDSGQLARITRDILLPAGSTSLGTIQVSESETAIATHTDKHGQPYPPEHNPY